MNTATITELPGAMLSGADPTSAVTDRVVDIWRAVLAREAGFYDHFFDIGGTALDAVLVADRVSTAFGVELPLGILFERPTVPEFVAVVLDCLTETVRAAERATRR